MSTELLWRCCSVEGSALWGNRRHVKFSVQLLCLAPQPSLQETQARAQHQHNPTRTSHNIHNMGLVDYSDSDGSDVEQPSAAKAVPFTSKPSFQKVVDRSNPGKIKVSLPNSTLKAESKTDEPPSKRVKTGGGAFSGFNSFLPAPKRAAQTTATLGGGNAAKKGLGAGVNLKTGAGPGFSREPESERYNAEEDATGSDDAKGGDATELPTTKEADGEQKPENEVKLVGKPLMFRPLSVSRKPAKKKKQLPPGVLPLNSTSAMPVTPQSKVDKPAQRPKVSLFSMATPDEKPSAATSNGQYTPMLEVGEAAEDEEAETLGLDPSYEEYTPTTSHTAPPFVPTPPVSQSLDDIAGDLKLSAAERRQLFGRGGRGNQSATNVINFNTDQEYLHNEELRAAGEQVMHNPVRALAAGKHSLKQLVNAAQSQKEALEESFAKGRSNRAEASSRYGW